MESGSKGLSGSQGSEAGLALEGGQGDGGILQASF